MGHRGGDDAGEGATGLRDLSPERVETFHARLERWWPDLRAGLGAVYAPEQVAALEDRLRALAAQAYAVRDPELHHLDLTRTLRPDWFQSPQMLGYAAYADRLADSLAGVQKQIPYLEELGVTYLHLMPLLATRAGDSDGGYAVSDYRTVRPDLGTVDDLRDLATALRCKGVSLVLDVVLNHVAREHAWAAAARAGDPRYLAYFHAFPDRTGPDAYERMLPEVFPDFAPGNFTWDDDLGAWVWTTFNEFQWDLDWSNPDVFAEFAEIVLYLVNTGVEVLRLDAIAFLWKRLGTNCQNQPEVHAITQALRALLRIVAPAAILKAEAIVGPDDLVQYLGRGSHHGKVSDLAYHNSLMVQIWSMLAAHDVRLTVHALRNLPRTPATTAWITYLRCHDDIGWAIDDRDAAEVGLSGHGHRSFLSDYYTGEYPGSPASGLVFQANPATGDRRVSGTTAALAGLDSARVAGDATAIKLAIDRILLAHAIVLGWGGIPVLWMGDELGLANDAHWADEPGHGADNRWVHRPRMPAAEQDARHDGNSVPGEVFGRLRALVDARARLPHLHASIAAEVLDPSDPGVLAVRHHHPEGDLLQLYNVTGEWRSWPGDRLPAGSLRDAISGEPVARGGDGNLWLSPYRAWWLLVD